MNRYSKDEANWNKFFDWDNGYSKAIVVTEQEAIRQNLFNAVLMATILVGSLMGGIEIGRQQVQSKLITDLQDGKVQCEVTTYSNKKEKFTEVRLGSISKGVTENLD